MWLPSIVGIQYMSLMEVTMYCKQFHSQGNWFLFIFVFMQFFRSAIFDTTCLHSPLKLSIKLWQCKIPMGFQNFDLLVIFGKTISFLFVLWNAHTKIKDNAWAVARNGSSLLMSHTKCFWSILTFFNSMFVTNMQLVFKSTHFVITLVTILFVTIVASVHSCICDNIMMDPNFRFTCNYNLWLSQI